MCFANPILAEIYSHLTEFSICPVLTVCQCVVCSPWLLLTGDTFSDHRNAPASVCRQGCDKNVGSNKSRTRTGDRWWLPAALPSTSCCRAQNIISSSVFRCESKSRRCGWSFKLKYMKIHKNCFQDKKCHFLSQSVN